MSLQLFGFDFIRLDSLYGFWFFEVKNWNKDLHRSLLSIYWNDGEFIVDFLFMRFCK